MPARRVALELLPCRREPTEGRGCCCQEGENQLPKVVQGITFQNVVAVIKL